MKGKKHSKESKKKISESLKKRVLSKESKEKMLRCLELGRHKGKKHSEETKRKISKIQRGRKVTSHNVMELLRKGREKHTRLIKSKSYWTEERRNIARQNGLDTSKKMLELKGNTLPEKKLGKLLDKLNVNHIPQYSFGCYLIDEYVPSKKLAIEVDGKYWHNYPQGRGVDRRKDGYLKMCGLNVLRVWEDELNTVKDFFMKGGE